MVNFKRKQGVSGVITTDGNGDGSVVLTMKHPMKEAPVVITTGINEADITGNLTATGTQLAITIVVDGSSVISGDLSVSAWAEDTGSDY